MRIMFLIVTVLAVMLAANAQTPAALDRPLGPNPDLQCGTPTTTPAPAPAVTPVQGQTQTQGQQQSQSQRQEVVVRWPKWPKSTTKAVCKQPAPTPVCVDLDVKIEEKEKPVENITPLYVLGIVSLVILGIVVAAIVAMAARSAVNNMTVQREEAAVDNRCRELEAQARLERERREHDAQIRRDQTNNQVNALTGMVNQVQDGREVAASGTGESFAIRITNARPTVVVEPRREPTPQRDPLDQRMDEMRKIRAMAEEMAPKAAPKAEAAPTGARALQTEDGDFLIPVSAAEKLMQAAKPAGAPKQQTTRRTGGGGGGTITAK